MQPALLGSAPRDPFARMYAEPGAAAHRWPRTESTFSHTTTSSLRRSSMLERRTSAAKVRCCSERCRGLPSHARADRHALAAGQTTSAHLLTVCILNQTLGREGSDLSAHCSGLMHQNGEGGLKAARVMAQPQVLVSDSDDALPTRGTTRVQARPASESRKLSHCSASLLHHTGRKIGTLRRR